MNLSRECQTTQHVECPDTKEDAADCECTCHVESTLMQCATCHEAPVAYGIKYRGDTGYIIHAIDGNVLTLDMDSSWDEVLNEYQWRLECRNGHWWEVNRDDVDIVWN